MTAVAGPARLRGIVAELANRRVLVVGDLMLDEYIWGNASRISPEAPVPIVSVARETCYPGGAANVARNVREFTPHTMLLGRVGADPYGDRLLALLAECGIDASGVERDAAARTTVKTRVLARNQQVARVDRETIRALSPEQEGRAVRFLEGAIAGLDAVIVADYGKGFLTQPFADRICEIVRSAGKLLAVDPHPHTSIAWRGATAVKPNRLEAFLAAGMPPSEPVVPVLSDAALLEAGRRLLESWQPRDLLITLGEHGLLLFGREGERRHIPTCAQAVYDVSGAGDTAIALFALALASGASPLEAAEVANRASGIVVAKVGTAVATAAELAASFDTLES